MQLGLIGLGRMGGNMARRLIAGGHQVVVCHTFAEKLLSALRAQFGGHVEPPR
ncbi:MAG TPA: NAD(P)-binding domain-containing protein [Vicinamibacterales bacterium]